MTAGRSIVAIPAHDEADRIGDCLAALAADPCARPLVIVVFANNCRDDTAGAARRAATALGDRLELHAVEAALPPASSHAGHARRGATEVALALCGPHDLLLTTDADARVLPGWRSRNHRAVADGADVVCGCAVIDPDEALAVPAHLHEDDRRETDYAETLDHVRALLDPDPADPWPRHGEESGASLAIRPAILRAVGGVPPVALGEDRALVRLLARHDARIRHDPLIRVIVSGRLDGRANGGMADTMRRRMDRQDEHVDDRLEPVAAALRRIRLRRALRDAREAGTEPPPALARRLGLTPDRLARMLAVPRFGAAWSAIEAASRTLAVRAPVRHAELAAHARRATRVLRALDPSAAGRADTSPPASSPSTEALLASSR